MLGSTFDSNELALFQAVLDRVCADQHIRDDFHRTALGKRIILKAQTGERRFQALADYAARDGFPPRLKAKNDRTEILLHGFSMIDPAADP